MSQPQKNFVAMIALITSLVVAAASVVYGYGLLNARVNEAQDCCHGKADAQYVHEAFKRNDEDHKRLTRVLEETQRDIKLILRRLPDKQRGTR